MTPQSIIEMNNLTNPNLIVPGQKLLIEVEGTEPEPPPPGVKTYVVQPGDTLYSIAQRTGVTVEQIVRLNNIENPNQIFHRQRLLLPPEAKLPDVPSGFFRYTIRGGVLCIRLQEGTGPQLGF